jgi:hypothetical protein
MGWSIQIMKQSVDVNLYCFSTWNNPQYRHIYNVKLVRTVWRYQRANQRPQVERKKRQIMIYKTLHKKLDWTTRTSQRPVGELMRSFRVGSSCSTSGTHVVTLVTNTVINQVRDFDYDKWNTSVVFVNVL